MNLYPIKQQFLMLADIASDPEADVQLVLDTFEALQGEAEDKLIGCTYVVNQINNDICSLDAEIKRLQEIKERKASGKEKLKAAMLDVMQMANIKKVDSDPRFTLIRKRNGGQAPLIIDGQVPENYCRVILEPDKVKIREALAVGALNFAHLGERGEHLEVK